MIPVTKTYLPPLAEYEEYLESVWDSGWVTNNARLSQLLEKRLEDYLNVPHVQYVSSGTIALQMAIRVMDIKGDIITTPFSYVATTSSILWEDCNPVYVDVDRDTLTIDPNQIEDAITEDTSAILATHVFGIPCDVDAIRDIADRHDLTVIYDAAHAFDIKYKGRPLLSFGDVSAISFHATKLFHTVEGGGVITDDEQIAEKVALSKNFGHRKKNHKRLGINGKNSELHAAMGLCLLPRIKKFIRERKEIFDLYKKELNSERLRYPVISDEVEYNYGYFPVIFDEPSLMYEVKNKLKDNNVDSRQYFYPSLNKLEYVDSDSGKCPISVSISERILCLPIYQSLGKRNVKRITRIINNVASRSGLPDDINSTKAVSSGLG